MSAFFLGWLLVGTAGAAPSIQGVTTSADYSTVTVVFSEAVVGTGTANAVIPADVGVTSADATLVSVTSQSSGATLVLAFDAAVQPATAVLTFPGSLETGVPLADGDWAVAEVALRSMSLPAIGAVPIASAFMNPDSDGNPTRTFGELLPVSVATSLDLPGQITVKRNTDGTFEVDVDGAAPLTSVDLTVDVDVDSSAALTPYAVELSSQADFSVDVALDGTITLSSAGAITGGSLRLDLDAAGSLAFSGSIGPVGATVDATATLDASFAFVAGSTAAPTATLDTATVVIDAASIIGFGPNGGDIDLSGPLLTFDWPTLPSTDAAGVRTETVEVLDTGWASAGLLALSNVSLADILGGPGALASRLLSAQDLGSLSNELPLIGGALGDALGIAETLATAQNEIAAAFAIAQSGFSLADVPSLTPDLCVDLRENRVRAAEVDAVLAASETLRDARPATPAAIEQWESDVLAAIPGVTLDRAAIRSTFDDVCGYLYDAVSVDLTAGTIEIGIDIPDAAFEFLTAAPSLDLAFDGSGLGGLGVAVEGDWTGTASASVDLTLGVKLVSAAELLATHGLVVDLADPNPGPGVPPDTSGIDVTDVTAAHRIYIPAGQIADANVSIIGSNLSGTAQLGFLDLTIDGDVAITPTVTMTAIDPGNGLADGKLDIAEFIHATLVAADGSSSVSTVLDVGIAGDDVDAHFQLGNNVVATTADIDVAGDLTGLFPGGTVQFRSTGISGPGAVPANTLAIGQTFGDTLDISALTPTEVVAMVADALDALAANASADAGDQRIPVIDVSLDEVAGFTSALSDVADTIRDRAPTTVTELEAFVNDALQANGMGAVTVGFDPSGPSGDPELTLAVDASLSAAASFPVSFTIDDFSLAPIDAGARLDAAVAVDFTPVLGIRFNDTDPFTDRIFVRDVSVRFDVMVDGVAEGGIAFGPVEASIDGSVTVGDSDLSAGGITVALTRTSNSSGTVPLSAFTSSDFRVAITGSLPVAGSLELSVPLLGASGTVTVAGNIPGGVTYTTDLSLPNLRDLLADFTPDLGTLANGAIETARFMARGTDEMSGLSGNIPVVGDDVGSGFSDIAETLDMVADEIEAAVAFLEDNDNDAADYLEGELTALFSSIGCSACSADVRWVGDGPPEDLTILNASGIEILLTLEDSITAGAATTASFGLEPIVELDIDVSNATAEIGYAASIGLGVDLETGFYLFPGIDNPTAGVGTMLEIYADLDLAADIDVTLAGVTASANSVVSVSGPLNGGTAAGLKVEMPDRVAIADIVNRRRSFSDTFTPSLNADIDAVLPVEFPVRIGDLDVEFLFPLTFEWSFADTLSPSFSDANFAIVDATLDISSFVNPVADLLEKFDEDYNPLSIGPIKDVLDTEIPLIETTVREALLAVCQLQSPTDPTCIAFKVLTDIPQLASDFRVIAESGGIPLGSFQIFPAPPPGISRYSAPGAAPLALAAGPAPGPAPAAAVAPGPTQRLADKVDELTGGYLSLPILSDYEAIMGIILGGELGSDVEFIRLEIPEDTPIVLGKSFNFKKTLIDLDVGFLDGNLKVDLNGGIGLRISGGFGYSSRGISTGNPFDGLFLIDNGASEVSLGASLRAAVDGRFALKLGFEIGSVRFRGAGGISAEAGLDLFDESPVLVGRGGGDGRLFFDEIAIIADAYEPPLPGLPSELCMFQLRTTGKWNLSFSGKAKVLGITVFNESYSDGGTLWDYTLPCTLRTRIARVEDRQLILHAGPNAGDRFDGEGDIDERFTLSSDGTTVTVNWVTADPTAAPPNNSKPSLTFPVASFDTIVADMGLFADSVDVANNITQPVTGRGGQGIDILNGGGGNDDLDGGTQDDIINGRSGKDTLRGGAGNDVLNGGAGNDSIKGGQGNDRTVFTDGFGIDSVVDSGPAIDTDTIDFRLVTTSLTGNSVFGESSVETGSSRASYLAADIETVIGGADDDNFTFKDQEPDGFAFDGSGGSDSATFLSGRRNRDVSVSDSGSNADTDDVTIVGTAAADNFLLRANSTLPGETATDGFVAKLSGSASPFVDRYDYDDSIEDIVVDGGLSADNFSLDDNAARTHIVGGQGDDVVQVGQVYGRADCEPNGTSEGACLVSSDADSVRGAAVGVDADDTFATRVITRGHLSNGVTHDLVIDGGDDDDTITIFANNAEVTANGGDGNDEFVARAFILTNSVTLNGDGGIDDFSYVVNNQLKINGGDGVDTFTVVGTEADDGFIIDIDADGKPTVRVCPIDDTTGRPDPDSAGCAINALVDEVEVFSAIGLEGDDVFWIRSTVDDALVELSGGEHSDRFLIGDGTLDSINGPVVAAGDDSGELPAMPDPVVLPGEDNTAAFTPAVTGGTDRGDVLEVDASTATDDLVGEITFSQIDGLGMASGPFDIGTGPGSLTVADVLRFSDLEFASVTTGGGVDNVTVSSTHAGNVVCDADGCPLELFTGGGDDIVDVQSIDGETVVDLGTDDDLATIGQPDGGLGDVLDEINAGLTVLGGGGDDVIDLDDSAGTATRVDIDPGLITQAGLAADGVSHSAVETVNVRLGSGSDTANIRGTAADATAGTHVYGDGGNDRFFVSSAAAYAISTSEDHLGGDLDDIGGPLFVHGETGDANQLMISDREAAAGNLGVTYDGAVLTGLAPAPISHDVVGGAFGRGITIWTSELADVVTVTGSDLSSQAGTRTLTTLNTGDGGDDVTVDLADGTDGAFVVNVEEGNDNVDASASSLDLLVFGGLGRDDLTTGSGNDIVIGDLATVTTTDGGTITGGGGPGDRTDGGTQSINRITSDPSGGDNDVISTGSGTDTAFGGTGDDDISGGPNDDLLVGGHSVAGAPDGADTISGDGGDDLIAGDNAKLDLSGAVDVLTLFDVETNSAAAAAGTGAADTLSGGDDDDAIYGQQGNDNLFGNGGDDAIEGNSGADAISGGDGQDDVLGGGSALDGVLDGDRAWTNGVVSLADDNDTIDGDDGADVLLGDNGWIVRTLQPDGSPTTLTDVFGAQNPAYDDMVVRVVQATTTVEPDGSFGADLIRGGDGHDELHGQLDTSRVTIGGNTIDGDELLGGPGDDVIVGDLGSVANVLEDGSNETAITDNGPFLDAVLRAPGSLTRELTLFLQEDGDHVDTADGSDASQFGAEGDDFMLGGDGVDSIHGGAGDDIANGGAGVDVVFGGDGDDALWGGPGDDELFGGHDEDSIDVVPRDFTTTTKGRNKITLGPDPAIWFEAAPSTDALAGRDVAYGGWNSDEMQADEKANGPKPGDRLVDWAGAYNRYLSCSNGGGAGTFLRGASPSIRAFLTDLAEGRGAVGASVGGTSGFRELGIVDTADIKYNAGSVGGNDHVACP